MRLASLILRELVGMFVDDEFLALAVLAVVAAAALLAWLWAPGLAAGGLLWLGSVLVLAVSALRAGRKR
jgi:hypothetical protein